MLRKFNLLVIDDEPGTLDGWQRLTFMLKEGLYLQPIHSSIDTNDNDMNYTVFTKQKGTELNPNNTFRKAIEHLETAHHQYDFFFFDINLANSDNKFIDDLETVYKRVPIDGLKQGEKSAYIAGLEFINVLQKDDRPKVFLSASDEVGSFLMHMSYVQNRFDDVMFGDFKSGIDFVEKVKWKIDRYLLKKQQEVCQGLTEVKVKEVLTQLESDQFDIPCIDCLKDKSFQWSLRTLFPRQCNGIDNYKKIISLEEDIGESLDYIRQIKEEIKNIIRSYPQLVRSIGKGFHLIDGTREEILEKLTSVANSLINKEFKKDNFKAGVAFVPISYFLPDTNAYCFGNFIKHIQQYTWSNIERYLKVDVEKFTPLLTMYGFYTGYLDYVLGIMDNNIIKNGQALVVGEFQELKSEKHDIKLYEIVVTSMAQDSIHEDTISFFQSKGLKTINDNGFHGEYSEGVQDIIKIICYRYRGAYEVMTRKNRVVFSIKDGVLIATQSSGDESLPDHYLVQKIIIYPLPTNLHDQFN